MSSGDEWYTPPEIIRSLGEFDLDPATSPEAYQLNSSAKRFYTMEENGLIQPWNGRIWLNPPYSNPLLQQFLMKMAKHNNGIALLFSKVGTKWFHDIILNQASAIKLLYERIQFFRPDGSIGKQPRNGSVLVAYGKEDANILANNKLKGKFLKL